MTRTSLWRGGCGCIVPEIATITGHSQAHAPRILDRYPARTRTLAVIAKLDEHRQNRKATSEPKDTGAG